MIWIIGGTKESRLLVDKIADLDYIVTVATEDGKDFLDVDRVLVGRLDLDDMRKLIETENIETIVDMTHPYAVEVSKNAKKVANEKNIGYLRYVRNKVEHIGDVEMFYSIDDLKKYLKKIRGTVFFTTGSNNIGDFEKVRGSNRFIYRILPSETSIKKAIDSGVQLRDIVAILGPFSIGYNQVMLEEYGADYCVTKNSGDIGGTLEKLRACKNLGIKVLLLERQEELGYNNLKEIIKILRS